LITKAKDDTTHSRRTVFSYLQNKESVKTLFSEVAGKVADRPGGYTRIIKMGDTRVGDNAEMCLIELVDFNTLYNKKEGAAKATKTRRSRRGGKKAEGAEGAEATAPETAAEPKAEKKTKKSSKKEKE
jgi:large subunit ribosomal protein L17